MRRLLQALCLMFLCRAALAEPAVASFAPQGQVKQVRQVTARFTSQMVPFGALGAPDPFVADCPQPGHGRWIDGSTWSYDFESDLPGAVACRFRLRDGLRDLAGQPLGGEQVFSLNTGGPAIVQSLPREGAFGIDERQVFILALDAQPAPESVEQHAWCRADGINERIGVRLVGGEERERFLALRRDFVDRYLTIYFKARGVVWRARTPLRSHRAEQLPVVVLQCQRALPADKEVALVWGPGIRAGNGIATDVEQKLAFRTRSDFSARMSCERVRAKGGCIPFLPVRLAFSAPVRASDAAAAYLLGPDGKRYRARIGTDEAKAQFVSAVDFPGPFPAGANLSLHLPAGLKDDAGRALVNQARFPMPVRIDEQPPLVKFAAPFGIVEARGDRMLPVTVRNVEPALAGRLQGSGASVRMGAGQENEVIGWLKKLAGGRSDDWSFGFQYADELERPLLADESGARKFTLPKPNGRRAFEVIGIPLRRPGFYVVELASPRLGAALNAHGKAAYVHSAALVTNLAAHFKHGAQSSLVWVTSLDKGLPVMGAQVEVRDCAAKLLWSGTSDAQGLARIGAELPESACKGNRAYFVSARKGDDFTFTLSDWNRGIETWRFHLPEGDLLDDSRSIATVFDRSLLRAGETVHMKHFLRRRTGEGFALVGAGDAPPRPRTDWRTGQQIAEPSALPRQVMLVHQGSDAKVTLPIAWDANGNAEGQWKIPAEARLGVYEVMIAGQPSGSFRVEQFRVPTMRAVLEGPKEPAVAAERVELNVQVSYLAGGPASGAPATLRTVVEDRNVSFDDYEDFRFAAGDVKEGMVKQGASFDDDEGQWSGEEQEGAARGAAQTRQLVLDRAGGARVVVDRLARGDEPKALLAELSYQDANGVTQTVSTRVPLWPSRYVVGIKPDGWMLSRDALRFQVAVLDVAGRPVPGAQVAVDFFKRATYSHRRRLVGGFYAYENAAEIKRLGPACEGATDSHGLLLCQVKAPDEGNLILRARTQDEAGRASVTSHDVWVAGRENTWFQVTDNDRIDLLPEKNRYEPGAEARFQVRSPFREATALVTVEREGILDTYVRHVSGRDPVVAIPIKGSYAPNVFVSVMLVRGRVASVPPTALVDLGKPAYKLGIAPVRVGWAAHELTVRVDADKPVYKVRERASVRVKVARADGGALPASAEVALAAVDEGLLELMPNDSWNLLETMMAQRGLQVRTATAQMQVVGKRHFGRKAVAHGGGGGRGQTRELFETLLLWRGKVALDAEGSAHVEVPLNDSLTSFRIVAIASAGAGLFGTGHTVVRSTQDLMLLSGLPNLVREGDRLRAGFTVRNTSATPMSVRLQAKVAADRASAQALPPQEVQLAPGQAQEIGWDYAVPQAAALQWEVQASAPGAQDRLRIAQTVQAAVPVRTLQATLVRLDGAATIKVARPAGALPGHGGVQTTFSPRLAGAMPGVRDFMAAYPYSCLEQRASQAVALRDAARWKEVVASLPALLDADGLAKYFAPMEYGSDTLTAYLLALSDEAGYAIPAEVAQRMQEGLRGFVQGRVVRGSGLATGELAVRKLAALEALSRSGGVRPDMLESFNVQPNLWPTSAVIDWYLVLRRSGGIAERDKLMAQAENILRARLNLQGTTMGFSTERNDDWWWLMASADGNANRLLLAMLDNPRWQADMGRLARGTLGRQRRGHWQTTLANAWGVLAMEKFSNRFEAEPVTGASSATLAGGWSSPAKWRGAVPARVLQAWPERDGELTLRHDGKGKPWATVQSLAAVPLAAPLSTGYRIARTITPVEQQAKGAWKRGDVYRVHLDIEAQSDMTWVVVDDPVPASATILGSGLARDSQIAASGERQRGWVWPAFVERRADAYRAYFEFVPKGKWSVEYTVRLNNEGRFNLPPTRVEAMYSPEMFGELPNAAVTVGR
ncbi:MG2 domain-containing protein [Massilia solisilvae]|uniref:MG2 domain-containing protein n=1 Tax=Massilia solisilvae TaxID=1811225 RepID=A0ABT2BIF1_9BURK|nr:MG2 domain-containing protein [Massilia solisilvae]MCS0608277.1 MG2 domain-containing protein [Massilia solisilvae]